MAILDTVGMNISEGLEQKHATESQPAKNRCGSEEPNIIATAGCKIFEASPWTNTHQDFLPLGTHSAWDRVISYFWNAGLGFFYYAKIPLIFY